MCDFLKEASFSYLTESKSPKPYSPSLGVDHNGVRLINHARDEGFAVTSSTYLGHLNDVSTGVSPVQVPCDPVHSNSTWHLQIWDLNIETQGCIKNLQNQSCFSCLVYI